MRLFILRHFVWLAPLTFCAEAVFARAGGGHSFSGGGHSGGGSYSGGGHSYGGGGSGGGDAFGDLIFLFIQLTFNRPLVGIPLDLALIYAFILVMHFKNAHEYAVSNPGPPRAGSWRRREL